VGDENFEISDVGSEYARKEEEGRGTKRAKKRQRGLRD
jgi:hypothetical protein